MEEGDGPQLVPIGTDGGFAIVALGSVAPAAPRPLAQVRDQVASDFAADRARAAARRIAADIVARAGKGPLPAALAATMSAAGVSLPAPRRLSLARAQLAANPRGVEPAVALLFSMAPGTAKLLEAPDRSGWQIVKLDGIQRGDARGNPQLVNATRGDLSRSVGTEYAEQFARAARAAVGARIDAAAVAQVRRDLTGQGAGDN
jgi:peptidyl-prolyl cis-trans isomerase D